MADVTGDGAPDLVTGEFLWAGDQGGLGRVLVAPGPLLDLSPDALTATSVRVEGAGPEVSDIGFVVETGDVDGDGSTDLILGAHTHDGPAGSRQGAVLVYLGPLDGTETTRDADLTLWGEAAFQFFGLAVVLGDVDGDAQPDLVVSAPSDPTFGPRRPGLIYVFRGPLTAGDHPASVASRVYRGSDAFELLGRRMALCGGSGAGGPDLLLGAPWADGKTGRVYRIPSPALGREG